MCECKKLLVVAEELSSMIWTQRTKLTDNTIQEIILNQALNGVKLTMENAITQIKQAMAIEEVKVNGDS